MTAFRHYLYARANIAIDKRRRKYDLEPSSKAKQILADFPRIRLRSVIFLFFYAIMPTPREMARLVWQHITDHDTPSKKRKIRALSADLRELLSPGARVIDFYFERRLYSRDLARVPKILEKMLHRTTPLLVLPRHLRLPIKTPFSRPCWRMINRPDAAAICSRKLTTQ